MFGDGSTERDYTYIDDTLQGMEGALRLARSGGDRYEVGDLGGSRTVSLTEMIRVLDEKMGVEPRVRAFRSRPET
jgi:UDP-glucuronate 4-epimerase